MKFLDALLGRSKPVRSELDRLFAMSTAALTLKVNLGLESSGRAGICFRPLTAGRFAEAEEELRRMGGIGERATNTRITFQTDEHGFRWVVLEDPEIEDLVAAMHMISLTLEEHGFGDRLLAAVFKFFEKGRPLFWIYNYKRGAFYPLVPAGEGQQRDNPAELRLRSLLEGELPMEADLERWYPLWGIPL